jgi:predicted RNA-binding Zn-ribbon protein involved in translation (DUF1610 family)
MRIAPPAIGLEPWRPGRLYNRFTGHLERGLLAGRMAVPTDINLHGGRLRYRLASVKVVQQPDRQGRKLLTDFLELAKAEDGEIQAYARKYGVLGLCSHWLPYGHPVLRPLLVARVVGRDKRADLEALLKQARADIDAGCVPPGSGLDTLFSEPLAAWRWYARRYRDLLESANTIREGERIRGAAGRFAQFRAVLSSDLDTWLDMAPLALRFRHAAGDPPELGLVPVNPLSALSAMIAAQVALAAHGSADLLVCSDCGQPYFPHQRPATGKHSYCPKCGRAAALRRASRRYYATHRKSILERRKEQ